MLGCALLTTSLKPSMLSFQVIGGALLVPDDATVNAPFGSIIDPSSKGPNEGMGVSELKSGDMRMVSADIDNNHSSIFHLIFLIHLI